MAFQGQCQAGHGARNACRFMAEPAAFAHYIAVFVLEHGFGSGGRGCFPVIDGFRGRAVAWCVEQKAATTDVAGAGLGYGQGKAGGYCGIDSIAAIFENLQGYFRGERMAGGYHALSALDGVKSLAFQNGLAASGSSAGCYCKQGCGCKAPQAPQRDLWQKAVVHSVHALTPRFWHTDRLS